MLLNEADKYETFTSDGHRLIGTLEDFVRLGTALAHAASDMAQARAACDMLDEETTDHHRARALETAIAVCYARAFEKSTLRSLPAWFAPKKKTEQRKVHNTLLTLRDKVYAHTDVDSGRSIRELAVEIDGDIAHVKHVESWHPLDRELLDPIRALCTGQESRFRLEAIRLHGAIRRFQDSAESGGASS